MQAQTSADQKVHDDRMSQLVDAHCEEADMKGAEFYNLGWAQGDYFIHSKTDQGRLYSELNLKTGEITHEWQER